MQVQVQVQGPGFCALYFYPNWQWPHAAKPHEHSCVAHSFSLLANCALILSQLQHMAHALSISFNTLHSQRNTTRSLVATRLWRPPHRPCALRPQSFKRLPGLQSQQRNRYVNIDCPAPAIARSRIALNRANMGGRGGMRGATACFERRLTCGSFLGHQDTGSRLLWTRE